MPMTATRYTRFLLFAFAIVTLAFVGSTVFQLHAVSDNERARSMNDNALPSIQHLTRARTHLRRILFQSLAWETQRGHDLPSQSRMMRTESAILNSELTAYGRLPMFSDEEALFSEVTDTLGELSAAVHRTVDALDANDEERAREALGRDVVSAAHRLDGAVGELSEINAAEAVRATQGMIEARRSAVIAALAADCAAALITIAAAAMVVYLFRRFNAFAMAHQRLLAERSAELESFASRVAHDLLSPLSGVSMAVSLALRSHQVEPRIETVLQSAMRSIGRVRSLIDGLLDFARAGVQVDRHAHAPLATLVEGVIEDARATPEGANVELVASELPDVRVACAPGVLMSVLSNLVGNAVKYSSRSDARRVTVVARVEASFVHCEVHDTGPGLPPGNENELFQPFVRGTYGADLPGLGLGLATVKKLIEAHGGAVGAERGAEKGTVFWFRLPLADSVAVRARSDSQRLRFI
jgi:signal transduction histidine kinase